VKSSLDVLSTSTDRSVCLSVCLSDVLNRGKFRPNAQIVLWLVGSVGLVLGLVRLGIWIGLRSVSTLDCPAHGCRPTLNVRTQVKSSLSHLQHTTTTTFTQLTAAHARFTPSN